MAMAYWHPLLPTALHEYEDLQRKQETTAMEVSVTEAVKQLLGGRAPGVDEVRPEFLKALDVVGLSWLTRLCNVAWRSGAVPVDWQTGVVVPIFKKGTRGCVPTIGGSHSSDSLGKSMPGCWKGEFYHSAECLSQMRLCACVSAVENAQLKASKVSQLLGQSLGPPLLVREDETKEWRNNEDNGGGGQGSAAPSHFPSLPAVTASLQVSVSFSLRDTSRKMR
uniref:Reverse transcriptase domain-containing protein n=1 Tax=Maylandia zebra TaxID=106582 RepID=A0A3P9BAF5_9CICH